MGRGFLGNKDYNTVENFTKLGILGEIITGRLISWKICS